MIKSVESLKILCLCASTGPLSWEENCLLEKVTPFIVPCMGIHPWKADRFGPEDLPGLRKHYSHAPMINEIGLDTVWAGEETTLDRQIPLFRGQLQIAREEGKAVTIHSKGAEQLILDILGEYSLKGVLIHWYDGPEDLLPAFLDYGCFFTIPPSLLKDRACEKLLSRIPENRVLPETDNPSAWPWLFGRTGKAEQIREIYRDYALLKGKTITAIHNQFRQNLINLLLL
jgi:TatD DNase family protein